MICLQALFYLSNIFPLISTQVKSDLNELAYNCYQYTLFFHSELLAQMRYKRSAVGMPGGGRGGVKQLNID